MRAGEGLGREGARTGVGCVSVDHVRQGVGEGPSHQAEHSFILLEEERGVSPTRLSPASDAAIAPSGRSRCFFSPLSGRRNLPSSLLIPPPPPRLQLGDVVPNSDCKFFPDREFSTRFLAFQQAVEPSVHSSCCIVAVLLLCFLTVNVSPSPSLFLPPPSSSQGLKQL